MEESDKRHTLAALTPRKELLVPTGKEADWVPESVWTL
jgi:hypothetical protein